MNPDAEAQRRFEALLDSVGVGVVVFGLDGKVASANLRAREVFNFPVVWEENSERVQHRPRGPRRGTAAGSPRGVPGGQGARDRRVDRQRRDRRPRRGRDRITWVLCGAQQLRDPDTKTATGVICTLVDITEQRASQEAIRASEERFRLFAENAADVIYRVGLAPLRFEYINPAVSSILGYTRDDFYRNPSFVFELVHPDDLEATRAHLADLETRDEPVGDPDDARATAGSSTPSTASCR